MSFKRLVFAYLFPQIILFGASAQISWGETVTGVVKSAEALDHTIRKWKLHMADPETHGKALHNGASIKRSNSSEKMGEKIAKKDERHAAFCWCITNQKKALIRYAYSYGESDSETAKKKAALAFEAGLAGAKCSKPPHVILIKHE